MLSEGALLSEHIGCTGKAWIADESWRIVIKKNGGWILGNGTPINTHTHITLLESVVYWTYSLFFY